MLIQVDGLIDHRMTRAVLHTNQLWIRFLRFQYPEHTHRQFAGHHHLGDAFVFLEGQATVLPSEFGIGLDRALRSLHQQQAQEAVALLADHSDENHSL